MKLHLVVAAIALATVAAKDPGQGTKEGCVCDSACGATVDFGNAKYDWCYTKDKCGSFSITRQQYYDYCDYPVDKDYESQTAEQKLIFLWDQVVANQTGGDYPNTVGIFAESVKTSFDDNHDYMPEGRLKYIHSVGSVGKFRLVPTANNPYTGIFEGSQHGLIRFSAAKAPEKDNLTPGFGIKFMRDNHQSANFFSMPSLDGQTDANFFRLNFTSSVAVPTGWILKILAQKFAQASGCPIQVGLSDCATWRADGTKVSKVITPYAVVWQPTQYVNQLFPAEYIDLAEMGKRFHSIRSGTHVFKLFAYASPAAKRNNQSEYIGDLFTTSEIVKSTFGDTKLLFKHQYKEEDFALHPEWLQDIDPEVDCGTDNVGPTPPLSKEEQQARKGFSGSW